MKLTDQNVQHVFNFCQLKNDESNLNAVRADGIMSSGTFHPGRLREKENEIIEMLGELPDQFKVSGGGGWSFLNLCEDKFGVQWTGFHSVCDQLVILGLSIEKVSYSFPRDYWSALPGSVPYLIVNI